MHTSMPLLWLGVKLNGMGFWSKKKELLNSQSCCSFSSKYFTKTFDGQKIKQEKSIFILFEFIVFCCKVTMTHGKGNSK